MNDIVNKNLGHATAYGYAKAGGYTGTEEEFEQLLGNVADILNEFENFSATAETLAAGSSATASYEDGLLSLGIPKGDKGDTGNGIQSIVLNDNYTLTITYTEGDPVTLGPIRGATGATPDISIGTVTTLNAGEDATASIAGTAEEPVLSLGIPKGPSGNTDVTAPLFSSATAYAAGDYVMYNDNLYVFTAAHTAGAWTGTDASQVTVGEELTDLKEDFDDSIYNGYTILNKSQSQFERKTGGALSDGHTFTPVSSTTRILSGLIPITFTALHIVPSAGYKYLVYTFSDEDTLDHSYATYTWSTSERTKGFRSNAKYIRLLIGKDDNTDIPLSDYDKVQFEVLNLIHDIDTLNNYVLDDIDRNGESLYIGNLINGHLTATGVVDDAFTNYRLSMEQIIALPCGSARKLKVKINEPYAVAIRSGISSANLTGNQYWFYDGDIITLPANVNYYAITICNAEIRDSAGTYQRTTISPTEVDKIGLLLTFDNDANIMMQNDDPIKRLDNARLVFSSSDPNKMSLVAIAHTSDPHGDYARIRNFMKFCDAVNVSEACMTGDFVSYYPKDGISWLHEIIKDSVTKAVICTGNHDVYNSGMSDSDIYDYMFEPIKTELGNTTQESWYYYDDTANKIRFISVNLYQYGGTDRWYTHFTTNQLDWIVATLASTPANYGVVMLEHAPQVILDNAKDPDYPMFFQNTRKYNSIMNAVYDGVPIYDIVDAFISGGTLSKTYTQTGSPASITVEADFTGLNSGVEFIAHLTGHFHQDTICYVTTSQQMQLMLNVTCTNALYGGTTYPYLADLQDQARNKLDATQDAFNVYVIDRTNKTVKVIRIGNTRIYTQDMRDYMEIPYAE